MVSSELQFMKVCEKLVTLLLVSNRPEGMVFRFVHVLKQLFPIKKDLSDKGEVFGE